MSYDHKLNKSLVEHAAEFYKQLQTIPDGEIPIIVPTFNLVTYAKFMVNQLRAYNLDNIIICDNNSTYEPMLEYLDEISKFERVVRYEENLGPRVYGEGKPFLSILPEYFIVTDPDLIFNKNLPKNFIDKMIRIINLYGVSKAGFAIDIEESKDKFFDYGQVKSWEQSYWQTQPRLYQEKDPLYFAPIDTTFCLHKKSALISELISYPKGVTSTTALRIAGRFTCEHMGWWKKQPLSEEELDYYNNSQIWGSTHNEKKKLGFA